MLGSRRRQLPQTAQWCMGANRGPVCASPAICLVFFIWASGERIRASGLRGDRGNTRFGNRRSGIRGRSYGPIAQGRAPRLAGDAFDNLRRRGSELALSRLAAGGVRFVHGDVRVRDDLAEAGAADWLIECSAEPSVHAGYGGSPDYAVATNLGGAMNCLEHLRRHGGALMFISSSRVYPIARLRALPLETAGERLRLRPGAASKGWSAAGISEAFPLEGIRSILRRN